jgi:hypothetical protein
LGAIKTLSVALKEASALAPARAGPSGRRGSRPGHGAHPLLALRRCSTLRLASW